MKTYILIGIIAFASCKSNENTMKVSKVDDCDDCPQQGKTFQGKQQKSLKKKD
jgi:hypothetical protein